MPRATIQENQFLDLKKRPTLPCIFNYVWTQRLDKQARLTIRVLWFLFLIVNSEVKSNFKCYVIGHFQFSKIVTQTAVRDKKLNIECQQLIENAKWLSLRQSNMQISGSIFGDRVN